MDISVEVIWMKLGPTPISQAEVELSSDNEDMIFVPKKGLTDSDGILYAVVTAPPVGTATDVTIFANAVKSGFKSNRTWITITINPVHVEEKFDLEITDLYITVTEDPVREGDPVKIHANITNTGKRHTTEFLVQFFVDGEQLGNDDYFNHLEPDGIVFVERTWLATEGNHTFRVKITALDPFLELDTVDNTAEKTLSVLPKKVIDDGNGDKDTTDKGAISPFSYWWLIIIAIIIVAVMLIFIILKRKKTDGRAVHGEPSPYTGVIQPVYAPVSETEQLKEAQGVGVPVIEGEASEHTRLTEPELIQEQDALAPEVEQPPAQLDEIPAIPALPAHEESEEPQAGAPEQPKTKPVTECPSCQNKIALESSPCWHCGTELNWD
jgi:hypothetical protein